MGYMQIKQINHLYYENASTKEISFLIFFILKLAERSPGCHENIMITFHAWKKQSVKKKILKNCSDFMISHFLIFASTKVKSYLATGFFEPPAQHI